MHKVLDKLRESMSNKLLTISVASYNVEEYLDKTLQSLICEPDIMELLEVIIVDDGSSVRTSLIAQNYVSQYPDTFVLIKKQNGGHGSTLNVAAHQAHGKYFRMLDGDDWYETKQLEKFVQGLENTNVDCVITPYCQIYGDKVIDIDVHNLENGRNYYLNEIMDEYARNSFSSEIMAPEFAIKTDILRKYGLCLQEKCMYTDKEYDLFAILYSRTFMKLPYAVYQYRLGNEGQSVGYSGRKKYLLDTKKVIFSMLQTIDAKKKYIVNDNHKKCLYHYVLGTIQFFCESILYASGDLDAEGILLNFMKELKVVNKEFTQYFIANSTYSWWEWLFSLKGKLEHKKCVIFGAGRYGEKILKYLKNVEIEPEALLDNNKQLWNTERHECVVESPDQLLSKYSEVQIIIAVKNQPELIVNQLLSMGVSEDRIIAFRK